MDPTKKVMASAAAPTACTYGECAQGEAGSAEHEQPGYGRAGRAGSTRTLTQVPERAAADRSGPPDLHRKVSVCSACFSW